MLLPFINKFANHFTRWLHKNTPRPTEECLRKLSSRNRTPIDISLPNIQQAPIEQGRKLFSEKKYAEALAQFSKAITINPHNPWAWHGRGDSLQLLGEYQGALEAYEKAISLASHEGIHHAGKANALHGLGRVAEGKRSWENALQRDPSLHWMKPKE